MMYFSPHDLDSMITYIEQAPRKTPYGRIMTRDHAARVIGVSLSSGNDVRLAMRLDSPNDGDLVETLNRCGFPEALDNDSPEHYKKLAAVLYAADELFLQTDFTDEPSSGTFQSFMKLVYGNPKEAAYMVEIAVARDEIDVELINMIRSNGCLPLDEGVL